ncbi:uncharacterized protein Z519_01867 [Cladophialophora bantiana CBS 173.52]|uniref:DUF7779 domain-containing protein n=1 Tax=Cladophialophora bantiana (strain ATCC 10958 / CBS 173.52 / CDC B-1940 / NIH 8579) TaxID=1442370 RepID=A0A0D2HXX9_CLAB1|nr:uncharacterized protein Z519_01867 [Cladophialophora bantiana CBS 173.52]KIW98283.1 hypothetical protein Z519_01867 [Cladophialophora bantiana CBS 173.52]
MEVVLNIGLREVETEACQLLNILAFFDNDNIHMDLLVGPHEDPLLEMLHLYSPMRWNRMTSNLSKRRLITVRNHDGEEVLTIHRKLQAKVLEELNQLDNAAERTKVFERGFLLIRGEFARPSPIRVLSIKRLWQSRIVEIPPSVKLARLISDAGIDLWERYLTVEWLELLISAEALLDQGGFRQDLLCANIHVVFKEAARIFDMCFEKYQRWGPPEEIPYEYAKYYHHKAYCLMYEGNFEQAVLMAEHGFYWVQVATGQPAGSNRWRCDLACLVLQSGDKEHALKLHKEVLTSRGQAHKGLNELSEVELYMRKILDIDQAHPGICTKAALAQVQFNLSQILAARAEDSGVRQAKLSARLQESAILAHPLGPLETDTGQGQDGLLTSSLNRIPEDHELVLFDHLQPVFEGWFTGPHLPKYLQY